MKWISLARLYLVKEQYEVARSWGIKARGYFKTKGVNNHLIAANEVLIDIGLHQNVLDGLIEYVDANTSIAEQQQLLVHLRNGYRQKSELYEARQQYQEAFEHFKHYKQLDDSVENQVADKALTEMQVKYKVDRIEQQNEILQLENDVASAQLRWVIMVSVFVLVLLLIMSWAVYSRNRLKSKLLQEEVDGLRGQIQLVLEGQSSTKEMDLTIFNDKLNVPLSEREFEVLKLAVSDLSNGQIAEEISASVNTVKYHLKNIYKKMGVSSRKEALHFAINTIK